MSNPKKILFTLLPFVFLKTMYVTGNGTARIEYHNI
jgi:hypothetical protein